MSREVCVHGRLIQDNGEHFCEECNKTPQNLPRTEDLIKEYNERFGFLDKMIERFAIPEPNIAHNWGQEIRQFLVDKIGVERLRADGLEKELAVALASEEEAKKYWLHFEAKAQAAITRAEEAEKFLAISHPATACSKVAVDALKAKLEQAEKEAGDLKAEQRDYHHALKRTKAELAQLQARVEELEKALKKYE